MFGIKFNFLSTPNSFSIPGSISRSIGRTWTFCSSQLNHLFQKIMQIVKSRLYRPTPKAQIPPPPTPIPIKKEAPTIEPQRPIIQEPQPIDKTPTHRSPPIVDHKPSEEANSSQSIVAISSSIVATPSGLNDSLSSTQSVTGTFNRSEARRKRREERRNNRSSNPNPLQSSSAPIDSHSLLPVKQPTAPIETSTQNNSITQFFAQLFGLESNEKYQYIECGGGGDCQLLSIFKGLELKYPQLLIEHKITSDLDLRKMGVDFAKQQIDKAGLFHAMVLGYLDSDRKEANEDPEVINKIANDEEFLKALSKKGFSCSATHLYALSHLLKIPIHVHNSSKATAQEFNPTQSTREPINLYLKNKKHYQLMVLR